MVDNVFITGTGRSGTNLLKDILSKHEDVASLPFEHRFTVDPDGVFDFCRSFDSWSPFIIDKKVRRLIDFLRLLAFRDEEKFEISEKLKADNKSTTGHPYNAWELEKWIPGYEEAINQLEADLCQFKYEAKYPGSDALIEQNIMYYSSYNPVYVNNTLSTFLKSCTDSICNHQKRKVFVEDNTWSFLFSKEISSLVPNSLIVYMIRDPRDVISSMKKQRWTPSNITDLVLYYTDLIRVWEEQKAQLSSDRYVEIKFENLINNKENVINDLCAKIGIEYSSQLLQVDSSKSNIGRHKTDLTFKEKELVDISIGHILAKYKYN